MTLLKEPESSAKSHWNVGRDGLFDSTLFTETWLFCLFFSPIVNSSREEAADGSSTHCRAEGAAVHSSVKRKRKK